MPIRILIAERYRLVREGLRLFLVPDLDLEIVGEAADGKEAIEQARLLHPDLVLMDLMLPDQDGIATIAALHQQLPQTQLLVLSGVMQQEMVTSALRAGAIGYLCKDIRASELRAAVKAAADGQVQLSASASAYVLDEGKPSPVRQPLTQRERDILRLLVKGYTNQEIARALALVEQTVKRHVRNILAKLGVPNRKQAILSAKYHQLIENA